MELAVVLVSGMAALDAACDLHALIELAQALAFLAPPNGPWAAADAHGQLLPGPAGATSG
jgi:hypothetical protein